MLYLIFIFSVLIFKFRVLFSTAFFFLLLFFNCFFGGGGEEFVVLKKKNCGWSFFNVRVGEEEGENIKKIKKEPPCLIIAFV